MIAKKWWPNYSRSALSGCVHGPYCMQVLEVLPVTVDALKQGNMGKLIKQLSKAENPG